MKKVLLAVTCLMVILLTACGTSSGKVVVVTKPPAVPSDNPASTEKAEETTASPIPNEPPVEMPSAAPTLTADAPKMYTSYAHMVSFNTETGTAEFDYFDMLRGKDAVKWLVEQEGYSQSDAEAQVNEYADSEYIEKNTNSQLRTIDLSNIPVYLIVNDDGTYTDDIEPRLVDIDTLKAIYAKDPKVLLSSFFYEVKVSNSGAVESVHQVYWP